MTTATQTKPYTLEANDKVAQVMVYTINALYWGEVVVKEVVRVSTWLRTNTRPDRVTLYNAKIMPTSGGGAARPIVTTELHVAVSQIIAFHLVPPAKDPLDFDPTEPNRRMEPVSMLIGNFRIDGHLRLAGKTNLAKFLEVTHEEFTSIYDAKVSNPGMASFGTIAVPYTLVRQELTVFMLP